MNNRSCLCYATIDIESKILHQSEHFNSIFQCNDNRLYNSALLAAYKEQLAQQDKIIITAQSCTKFLLISPQQNLVLHKCPSIIRGQIHGINVFAEQFKINNLNQIIPNYTQTAAYLPARLKNIHNYSQLQQEVIFCLMLGMHSNKAITNFIEQRKQHSIAPKSVTNCMDKLFAKLNTNNRQTLIALCLQFGFDKNIPATLYAPGIYNLTDFTAVSSQS